MDTVIRYWDFGTKVLKSTAAFATSMIHLERTLPSLKKTMDELIAIRDDVKRKLQLEEEHDRRRTNQVEDWLEKVEETERKVKEVLAEHEDIRNHGFVFRFGSTCMLGPRSTELLDVIQELLSKRKCLELAIQWSRSAPTRETKGLCEIPMGGQKLVGIDFNLEEVLKGLKDDNVGMIGLYGMGGVGKTTLLKKINNGLPKSGNDAFEYALWVVASGNATIETIQQDVLEELGIHLSNKSVNEKRNEIYNNLKNRKYLLMLDDIWEYIDLYSEVGIPKPDNTNKSKIIFTTRSKIVCFQMRAHSIIEVECLPWEEAWSLFQEEVGKATLNPQIESYAIKVAEECNGLPIALITIGRAMSGKVTLHEWSHALHLLQNYPAEIPHLATQVFPKLQFSYDYLADSTKQKCFLYCSLFPEDWEISCEELVNLWMGEGYLNKIYDIKTARDYGYSIIEDLKRACLLESASDPYIEQVRMHDVIRDMALWIAKKEFLVVDKAGITMKKTRDHNWNGDVGKMSFWNLDLGNSSIVGQEMHLLTQDLHKLSTLLVRICREFSLWGLINFIPNIRVLCFLSSGGMSPLPKEISKLKNLEYLDISYMGIKRLPKEMKSLSKLRYLLMNDIILEECPAEIISGLTELLVFRMSLQPITDEQLLKVLKKLQFIQDIGICLGSPETLNYFQDSEKLQLCTTEMKLQKNIVELLELSPSNMRNLEKLAISDSDIKAIKCKKSVKLIDMNYLRMVVISECNHLKELDILAYAPSLKRLILQECRSIKRIIKVKEGTRVFESLKDLRLIDLASLEYVCNSKLSFPNLESVRLFDCPNLKNNPLNDVELTTCKISYIRACEKLWNSLTDDRLKLQFSENFPGYLHLINTDE